MLIQEQISICEIYEKYRRKYRPRRVKVLFLAESPPKSSGSIEEAIKKFFYYDGNRQQLNKNSLQVRLRELLVGAGFKCLDIHVWKKFLERFRDLGFYLEDTIKCPLDKDNKYSRNIVRKLTVNDLREINPEIIVVMGRKALKFIRSIYKNSLKVDEKIMKLHGIMIEPPSKIDGLEVKYLVFSVFPTACQFLRRVLDRPCIKPFKELRSILKDLEC